MDPCTGTTYIGTHSRSHTLFRIPSRCWTVKRTHKEVREVIAEYIG